MAVNFCPQCGRARVGNFCGGCGFNFIAFEAGTVAPTAATGTMPAASVDAIGSAEMPLPNGLVMGEAFDPARHCANCGLETRGGGRCAECSMGE